jgi:hypothetical protein
MFSRFSKRDLPTQLLHYDDLFGNYLPFVDATSAGFCSVKEPLKRSS